MASIEQWNKYMAVVEEIAYIEDDLRTASYSSANATSRALAKRILFERFDHE